MNRTFTRLFASLSLASSLLSASAVGHAAVVSYTGTSAFNAALGLTGSDGFDDLGSAQSLNGAARTTGAGAYLASVVDTTGVGSASGGNDLFTVDAGGGNIWLSTAVAGNALVFSGFDGTVFGIGGLFFGTDVDGAFNAGQSFELTLTDVLGVSSVMLLNNVMGTDGFVGFVSTQAIAQLSVLALQPAGANPGEPASYSYATVDHMIFGQATPVPEPASLALAALALWAAAAATRRRAG